MLAGVLQRFLVVRPEQPVWLAYAVECLAFLSKCNGDGIRTAAWGQICAWFGPATNEGLLLRVAWLSSKRYVTLSSLITGANSKVSIFRWFFANTTPEAAAELVATHPPGSWLLRFSGTETGGFAFTVRVRDDKVMHYRVSRDWHTPEGTYLLKAGKSASAQWRYTSLGQLIAGARKELELREPVMGSTVGEEAVSAAITALYTAPQLSTSRAGFFAIITSPSPLS